MSPRTRTVKPAEARLEDLLDAAEEILATRGLEGSRVADITDAAGTAVGTFYRFFDGKDEIVAAVRRRRVRRALADAATVAAGIDDWWAGTDRRIEALVDVWLEWPELSRVLLSLPGHPDDDAALIGSMTDRMTAARRRGIIDVDDLHRTAVLFVEATRGLLRTELARGEPDRAAILAACRRMVHGTLRRP